MSPWHDLPVHNQVEEELKLSVIEEREGEANGTPDRAGIRD
jgi:hypothetical protein